MDVSTVAGVRISHPDRLIYADLGISRIQLARYFDDIAEWIVPERGTLTTVPKRLKRMRVDPWREYWAAAQEISTASFEAIQQVRG